MSTTPNFHFQVGALRCLALNDGTDYAPAERIILGVPTAELYQALAGRSPDPTHEPIAFNCLYLETGQSRILVDAGWGTGTERRDGQLIEQLAAEGLRPGDIDLIILTHEDVDHTGGLLTSDGQIVFANAEIIMPQPAWDFWSDETRVARTPESLHNFPRQILPYIRERVRPAALQQDFLPGFQFIYLPGHRPGHAAVEIVSEGQRLLHLADGVGHPLLMEHPSWRWAYDADPERARGDKARLLALAATNQSLLLLSHFPFPGVGRVTAQGEGWTWRPLA
jgi:glyoxylase-like metal-dependent hydrolase (beta-lactamase superfamily II)